MTRTERLSHIGILLIGISALIVSVWQVQMSMQHNKLSVKPLLRFSLITSTVADGKRQAKFVLTNNGLGPALINKMRFVVNGVEFTTLPPALKAAHQSEDYTLGWSDIAVGEVIEEKAQLEIMNISNFEKTETIIVKVAYESLYGEKAEVTSTF